MVSIYFRSTRDRGPTKIRDVVVSEFQLMPDTVASKRLKYSVTTTGYTGAADIVFTPIMSNGSPMPDVSHRVELVANQKLTTDVVMPIETAIVAYKHTVRR